MAVRSIFQSRYPEQTDLQRELDVGKTLKQIAYENGRNPSNLTRYIRAKGWVLNVERKLSQAA